MPLKDNTIPPAQITPHTQQQQFLQPKLNPNPTEPLCILVNMQSNFTCFPLMLFLISNFSLYIIVQFLSLFSTHTPSNCYSSSPYNIYVHHAKQSAPYTPMPQTKFILNSTHHNFLAIINQHETYVHPMHIKHPSIHHLPTETHSYSSTQGYTANQFHICTPHTH